MGPQPSSRGNLRAQNTDWDRSNRLQWGRNLPVAEIMPDVGVISPGIVLQWGRNLPVAEIAWSPRFARVLRGSVRFIHAD